MTKHPHGSTWQGNRRLLCRKSDVHKILRAGLSGQRYIRMQNHIVRCAMLMKGRGDHCGGMNFPSIHK